MTSVPHRRRAPRPSGHGAGLRRAAVRVTGAALLAAVGLGAAHVGVTATPAPPAGLGAALTGPRGQAASARPVDPGALGPPARRIGPRAQGADQIREQQWQVEVLGVERAWHLSTGRGVTVAVIDSGVDVTHPDLRGQVLRGVDLVAPGDGRRDPVGHGTTVAGLIAGRADDSAGVIGLAPDAKILPVRVLDEQNRYDDALIVANGVRWAVDNGADVINLSLGGSGNSAALAAAIDYAFARDVVVVACAGNTAASTTSRVWYPAREPGVIAVAGMDRDMTQLWSGSVTGPQTVLTAPATELVGARPDGFWRVQGTSFAAPMVAATAALVRSRWPSMSAGDVVNRLVRTAADRGPRGRDARFGYGVVDPVAALTDADTHRVGRNPLDDTSSPGVAGFGRAPGAGLGGGTGGDADGVEVRHTVDGEIRDAVGGAAGAATDVGGPTAAGPGLRGTAGPGLRGAAGQR